ncbi:MAG TPA: hypothetical protein VFI96_07240 [Longimicrobiaceae bacterium]|nr:hypothetical protein [Longimicrobiaceae bacterium]
MSVMDWNTATQHLEGRAGEIARIRQLLGNYATIPGVDVDSREEVLDDIYAIARGTVNALTPQWGGVPTGHAATGVAFALVMAEAKKEALKIARAQHRWGALKKTMGPSGGGKALFNPSAPTAANPNPTPQSKNNYWLELADPKHRPWGHLDQDGVFDEWLQANTTLSFFEWADQNGKGSLPSVEYVARDERWRYRIRFKEEKFHQLNQSRELKVYSTRDSKTKLGNGFAIWVCSTSGAFYAHSHVINQFHHSSFLAGDRVICAGEWGVRDGKLLYISRKTGHYRSEQEDLIKALQLLASCTDVSDAFFHNVEYGTGANGFFKVNDVLSLGRVPDNQLPYSHDAKVNFLAGIQQEILNPAPPSPLLGRERRGAQSKVPPPPPPVPPGYMS